jgi:hypothetical protein
MRRLYFSALLMVGLAAALALYLAPLQPGVLALQLAWQPRAFGAIIHVWPAEHLARYRAHLPFDFLLIAAYAVFGHACVSCTRWFASCAAWVQRSAKFALPLAGVFDGLENLLHYWLTAAPRFGVPELYALAAACAALKWLLLFGFALALLWVLARE